MVEIERLRTLISGWVNTYQPGFQRSCQHLITSSTDTCMRTLHADTHRSLSTACDLANVQNTKDMFRTQTEALQYPAQRSELARIAPSAMLAALAGEQYHER